MAHPASRDFALRTNGSRCYESVRTGSIPATSTLIMPLTCNDAVSRSRIPLPPPVFSALAGDCTPPGMSQGRGNVKVKPRLSPLRW